MRDEWKFSQVKKYVSQGKAYAEAILWVGKGIKKEKERKEGRKRKKKQYRTMRTSNRDKGQKEC